MSRWTQDAPDHFSRRVSAHVQLGVWPMLNGSWTWDYFDSRLGDGEPQKSGKARSYVEATKKVEAYAEKVKKPVAAKKKPKPVDEQTKQAQLLERAIARDEAVHRVLKLAVPWAHEMRTREVLSSKTHHLVNAVLKYEKLQ